jgi:hypothetical protein
MQAMLSSIYSYLNTTVLIMYNENGFQRVHRDKPADYSGLRLKNNAFFPPGLSSGVLLRVQLTGHAKTSTHKDGISQKVAYPLSPSPPPPPSSSSAAAAAAAAAVAVAVAVVLK